MVLLGFVTLGSYWFYYYFSSRKELVRLGADIPTAWLIFIPFISTWWHYKWFKGGEHVTRAFNGTKFFLVATIPHIVLAAMVLCFIALSVTTTSSTVATYDDLEKISSSQSNDQLVSEPLTVIPISIIIFILLISAGMVVQEVQKRFNHFDPAKLRHKSRTPPS